MEIKVCTDTWDIVKTMIHAYLTGLNVRLKSLIKIPFILHTTSIVFIGSSVKTV